MLRPLNRETAGLKQTRPVKVIQFGDGNFMRGFMDWIIDILNEKTDFDGSVLLIRPLRKGKDDKKFEQDGLFHVAQRGLLNGKTVSETRLITCVNRALNPYLDFDSFLRTAENSDLQFIISNTTEAGIAFDASDSDINSVPNSFPGKVTRLLFQRFTFFKKDNTKGLSLIPCELIEKNGEKLREIILQYAEVWNLPADFKSWIVESNTFCNTLVDRIVPGFPKDSAKEIQESVGYEDSQIVMAEPYHLLVIEPCPATDTSLQRIKKIFPAEKAGLQVKFVSDVTPYRTSKVRILNGAHTTLVPIAYLRGLRTVMESINDAYIGDFVSKAVNEEIIPTLDLPEDELRQFASDVIERFKNPFIRHELISIALNSISKFKVRVLPSILEYERRTKKLPNRLLQAFAALIVFYKGSWRGVAIPLNDSPEVLAFFKDAWASENVESAVHKTLSHASFWGSDLTEVNGLEKVVTNHVIELLNADVN